MGAAWDGDAAVTLVVQNAVARPASASAPRPPVLPQRGQHRRHRDLRRRHDERAVRRHPRHLPPDVVEAAGGSLDHLDAAAALDPSSPPVWLRRCWPRSGPAWRISCTRPSCSACRSSSSSSSPPWRSVPSTARHHPLRGRGPASASTPAAQGAPADGYVPGLRHGSRAAPVSESSGSSSLLARSAPDRTVRCSLVRSASSVTVTWRRVDNSSTTPHSCSPVMTTTKSPLKRYAVELGRRAALEGACS